MPVALEQRGGNCYNARNRYTLKLKESPTQNHKLCGMPFVSLFAGGCSASSVCRTMRALLSAAPFPACANQCSYVLFLNLVLVRVC